MEIDHEKLTEKCNKLLDHQKLGIQARQDKATLSAHSDTLRATIVAHETTINTQKAQITELESNILLKGKQIQELEIAKSTHMKIGEALISNVVKPPQSLILGEATGASTPAPSEKDKVLPPNVNKAHDKQVKSLMGNVKELEERVVYLTNENSNLRKKCDELQLDLHREKQITNMHLKLTADLAAAKEALKNPHMDDV